MNGAELAQRGHSKEKRYDLKIIGLSLMLTTDFQIPLFHQVYPGNRTDSAQFGSVTEELVQRYKRLAGACNDITLVYDKGNNSLLNQKAVDGSPLFFVGSLKSCEAPELLDVPQSEYALLKKGDLAGTLAYRIQREVLDATRTVVVTYNEALYLGQLQGHLLKLRKLTESLKELAASLARRAEQAVRGKKLRGHAPTVSSVVEQAQGIMDKCGNPYKQWVKTVVEVDAAGMPRLLYQVDHDAMDAYNAKHLGKTIIFTDRHDWSSEEIVRCYRSQWHVEAAFRDMKDPCFLSWEPQFHWTDQKIMVHAFYCVMALTLVNLARRKLHFGGIELSNETMLRELAGIKEVLHIYPKGSPLKDCITLSKLSDLQRKIITFMELENPGSDNGDISYVVGG
jgi:transposase